jgi:enoyl-CoA hydratase
VEGYAVAGGLELALMCDLRVAARSAVFGVFCRRWGVPLIDGGTVRLPRIVGVARALDLILTGRAVAADEALAMGLANRVVDDGQALAEAQALARQIAAFPQQCLLADRASALAQWDLPLPDALQREGAGGFAVVQAEGLAGAARFAAGAGRHGGKA